MRAASFRVHSTVQTCSYFVAQYPLLIQSQTRAVEAAECRMAFAVCAVSLVLVALAENAFEPASEVAFQEHHDFLWWDTAPADAPGHLRHADVKPHPVVLGSQARVEVTFETREFAPAPLQAQVHIQKAMHDLFARKTWMTLPCLPTFGKVDGYFEKLGSCTYENICDWRRADCPVGNRTVDHVLNTTPPNGVPEILLDGEFVTEVTLTQNGKIFSSFKSRYEIVSGKEVVSSALRGSDTAGEPAIIWTARLLTNSTSEFLGVREGGIQMEGIAARAVDAMFLLILFVVVTLFVVHLQRKVKHWQWRDA